MQQATPVVSAIMCDGKSYIHGLISAKYRAGIDDLSRTHLDLLPPALVEKRLRNGLATVQRIRCRSG